MIIKIEDRINNNVLTTNKVISNITILDIDSVNNICIITKTIEYCAGEKIVANPAKLELILPVTLSKSEMATIGSLFTTIQENPEKYAYRYVNKRDRGHYTDIDVDNGVEKYTMESNDNILRELSKLYMPEVLKHFKIDKLKFQ